MTVEVADAAWPKVRLVGLADTVKPGILTSISAVCESDPELPTTLKKATWGAVEMATDTVTVELADPPGFKLTMAGLKDSVTPEGAN